MSDRSEIARRLLACLDLTSLNDARDDDIAALCAKAITSHGPVAAVCAWPEFAGEMVTRLADQAPKVAVVINFPQGEADAASAAQEAKRAVAAGAQELDLVWPYKAWLAGDRDQACALIAAVKEAGAGALLKVILETGALGEPVTVRQASEAAIAAGADMLKTSTGKIAIGATLPAAEAMLEAIRSAGGTVGFKASGGLRGLEDAAAYLGLAERILGPGWATPARFRIGASRLLDEILAALDRDEAEASPA
jgi:deoxyribose-phosphate aldolase